MEETNFEIELEKIKDIGPEAEQVKDKILHAIKIYRKAEGMRIVQITKNEKEIDKIINDDDKLCPSSFRNPIQNHIEATKDYISLNQSKEEELTNAITKLFQIIQKTKET